MENETLSLQNITSLDQAEHALEKIKPFMDLMVYYQCALYEVETKLRVLDTEFSATHHRNPIQNIKTRIKKPRSIIEKLQRKNLPLTIESIEKNLNDIAGIRVICSFPDEIYQLAIMLSTQDDIKVIAIKDYIKNPKPNGYRSLHLILEIPIFLSTQKKYIRVEAQFRTIAMDFWASLEHQMKYKKELANPEQISQNLKECAEQISAIDDRMQSIRDAIMLNNIEHHDPVSFD